MPSSTEVGVFRQASSRARRAAGPASAYYLDSFRLDRHDKPFRRNDVIVQVYDQDGERWVWPPVVVFSDPAMIPRSRSFIQLVRGRADLQARPANDVAKALRMAGVAGGLDESRWVRSSAVRDALLAVWDLTSPA